MNHPCATSPSLCFDPSNPTLPGPSSLFQKYSSEAPDVDIFFGRNYRPFPDFPPLGSIWYSPGCTSWCISSVSQQAADECAQRQAALCIGGEWPVETPNPNPDVPDSPPTVPTPREMFPNQQQIDTVECPDGSHFSYVVNAGTFYALITQAANIMALSYAHNQAIANRVCLSELLNGNIPSDGLCSGQVGELSINASSGHTPVTFLLTAGAIPSGMAMSQTTSQLTISGIPAAVGTYPFTIQATDSFGNTITKSYTLYVEGIATNSLPAATVGTPYSATLLSSGPTSGAVTWQVLVGSLPSGLSLDINSGVISGTPTTAGSPTFTVLMTDNRVDCQRQFTIAVSAASTCALDFTNTAWTPIVAMNGCSIETHSASGPTANSTLVNCYDGTQSSMVLHGEVEYTGQSTTGIVRSVVTSDINPLSFVYAQVTLVVEVNAVVVASVTTSLDTLGPGAHNIDLTFNIPASVGAVIAVSTQILGGDFTDPGAPSTHIQLSATVQGCAGPNWVNTHWIRTADPSDDWTDDNNHGLSLTCQCDPNFHEIYIGTIQYTGPAFTCQLSIEPTVPSLASLTNPISITVNGSSVFGQSVNPGVNYSFSIPACNNATIVVTTGYADHLDTGPFGGCFAHCGSVPTIESVYFRAKLSNV